MINKIKIALFWYESILYMNDPALVWNDVLRAFNKEDA